MYASVASANRVGGAVGSSAHAGAVAAVTPSVDRAASTMMMTTGDVSGEASGAAGDGAARQHPIAQRPIDRVLMVADSEPRPRLGDFNRALTCGCCKGYLINAVKIEDCHHTFCRSCIVQYIKNVNKQCPTCLSNAPSQSDKPQPNIEMSNLILDRVLQSCVYKLVPGLYRREQQRQSEFYKQHGLSNSFPSPVKTEEGARFISPDELMSLSVEYESTEIRNENKPKMEKRYLQCPAAVTINHLEKLLRNKYTISPAMSIEIKYKQHLLSQQLSLMDVVYIYGWQRDTPMEFSYSIACAAAEPEDSASDSAPPTAATEPQNVSTALVFKPPAPPSTLALPPTSTSVNVLPKQHKDVSTSKHNRDVSHSKQRETPARMIYDPENKHMQPRVELTEYARNIGLTAVKNGSSHYDFREDKADRLDDDRAEFAKKRDREWAAQKQLDERHHTKDDTNTHRKRKKAKHSKNDDNQYKRRKLHAQITSPESPEDALKMKVKLTPTPTTKHKHKYHIEPITAVPVSDQQTAPSSALVENKDVSTKEKLLQMRAVRKDKVTNVQTQKTEQTSQAVVSVAASMPLLDKVPINAASEKTPIIKLPPIKLPTNKLTFVKPPIKLGPIKTTPVKSPTIKAPTSKCFIPSQPVPAKAPPLLKPVPPKPTPVSTPPPKEMEVKITDVVSNKRPSPTTDDKSEPPVTKTKLDPEVSNSISKEEISPKPLNSDASEKIRDLVNSKPNSISIVEKKEIQDPPKLDQVKVEAKIVTSTSIPTSNTPKLTVVTSTPKVTRPPPATIPLVRIKKSVGKTVTFSTGDKTFTTNAKSMSNIPALLPKTPELNNPMCDNIGALDLSGKSSRSPTSETRSVNSPSPPAPNRLLNGVTKHKKPSENPMSNLQMLSESAVQILSQSKTTVSRMPIKPQTIHNTTVRPSIPPGLRIPQLNSNAQLSPKPLHTILKLNEIKGLRNTSPRPQNQSIRSIPNPSALNFRPAQAKPTVQDETKKIANVEVGPPTTSSAPSEIKKIDNIAKNLHLEKVTAELVGRASEANKLHAKTASQMTTP